MKLNIAVMRRSIVAVRGLDRTFLTWLCGARLPVRPTLSTAYSTISGSATHEARLTAYQLELRIRHATESVR